MKDNLDNLPCIWIVRNALAVAMRTFTTGSLANGTNLGKKKDAKSAAQMPASNNTLQICTKLSGMLSVMQ